MGSKSSEEEWRWGGVEVGGRRRVVVVMAWEREVIQEVFSWKMGEMGIMKWKLHGFGLKSC